MFFYYDFHNEKPFSNELVWYHLPYWSIFIGGYQNKVKPPNVGNRKLGIYSVATPSLRLVSSNYSKPSPLHYPWVLLDWLLSSLEALTGSPHQKKKVIQIFLHVYISITLRVFLHVYTSITLKSILRVKECTGPDAFFTVQNSSGMLAKLCHLTPLSCSLRKFRGRKKESQGVRWGE